MACFCYFTLHLFCSTALFRSLYFTFFVSKIRKVCRQNYVYMHSARTLIPIGLILILYAQNFLNSFIDRRYYSEISASSRGEFCIVDLIMHGSHHTILTIMFDPHSTRNTTTCLNVIIYLAVSSSFVATASFSLCLLHFLSCTLLQCEKIR